MMRNFCRDKQALVDVWSSLICNTVTRPSNTERGIIISSVEGTTGSLRRTTNIPSLAIEATERYLFTSLTSLL